MSVVVEVCEERDVGEADEGEEVKEDEVGGEGECRLSSVKRCGVLGELD